MKYSGVNRRCVDLKGANATSQVDSFTPGDSLQDSRFLAKYDFHLLGIYQVPSPILSTLLTDTNLFNSLDTSVRLLIPLSPFYSLEQRG